MKVYIVWSIEEVADILGVFSTKEKAEEVAYGSILEMELDDYCRYHGNLAWYVSLDVTTTDPKYHGKDTPFSVSAYGHILDDSIKETPLHKELCCGRPLWKSIEIAKKYSEAIQKAIKKYNELIEK